MNGSEPLLTYEQSRHLDQRTMELGWTSTQLMGQAALSSLYRLQKLPAFSHIIILCGPGNNGGDGLALAWQILSSAGQKNWGADSSLTVVQTARATSEASSFYERLLAKPSEANLIELVTVEEFLHSIRDAKGLPWIEKFTNGDRQTSKPPEPIESRQRDPDLQRNQSRDGMIEDQTIRDSGLLIVEALLGSGQNRPLEGSFAELGRWISEEQSKGAYLLSLDVPAGLLESERFTETALFDPDEVHTYGPHRLACALDDRLLEHTSIYTHPIGFSPDMDSPFRLVRRDANRLTCFQREGNSHKYSNGSGWLMGGSTGMEGAMLLSARSFFSSGGGILQGITGSQMGIVREEPSIMIKERLSLDSRVGAITMGPGCSKEDCIEFLEALSEQYSPSKKAPSLILDAAAAVEAVQNPKWKKLLGRKTILTPHPGEWAAMGGAAITDVDSLRLAMEFARDSAGSFVLYKASTSILMDPFEDRAYLFPWINRSLAVARTGDCLTGILMSALCRSDDMITSVMAAMELLHASTETSIHPRSSRFPSLIQRALGKRQRRFQSKDPLERRNDGKRFGGLH